MLTNLKALVVILCLAWVAFHYARPLCLQNISETTFRRRRNVWFALTIVAFISPAFWVYALFALSLLWWAGKRDDNPLALCLLVLFAVPNARYFIPTVLIGQLFDLTHYRILSLVVIIPAIGRMWKQPQLWGSPRLKLVDVVLLAFLLLQVVLNMPYESVTTTMRRAFLFTIDNFVLFYAFSRVTDRVKLRDLLTCFWLAVAIMALVAIVEWGKGWLIYTNLADSWGDPDPFSYLYRGGFLRAQAAAGHSINLGYVLSVGLGFFLYLRTSGVLRKALQWGVMMAMACAILATYARGPWLTAAIAVVLFIILRPDSGKQLAGALAVGAAIFVGMYFSPLKELVIDKLPFIGTADQNTVDYRRQLAEVSWLLIKQNPFFGDPFVASRMESLRQGQGIIDIVNGYIFTALFTGLVGLALLVSVFGLSLWGGVTGMIEARRIDRDMAMMGASLVAVFLASLFFVATAGYGPTTYMTAAMLVSYRAVVAARASAGPLPNGFVQRRPLRPVPST